MLAFVQSDRRVSIFISSVNENTPFQMQSRMYGVGLWHDGSQIMTTLCFKVLHGKQDLALTAYRNS